jgi:hypothetical protein
MRQTHRWVSIAFTLTVVANFAAMTQGPPPAWVTYAPLLPLAVLLLTGLYLFALPYTARFAAQRRGARRTRWTGGITAPTGVPATRPER